MRLLQSTLPALATAVIGVVSAAAPVNAQLSQPQRVVRHSPDGDRWRFAPEFRLAETFDDNPFLLSDSRKSGLQAPSSSSVTNGRYDAMTSSSDYITSLRGGFGAQGPLLGGHKASLSGHARYEYYQSNVKRRNMVYDLRGLQSLGHGSELGARAEIQPKYFFRNFLSDAIDLNGDRVIDQSERIYAAGTFSDQEFAGEFSQRVLKPGNGGSGATLTIEAGRKVRNYQQPFQTRSYRGPFVGGGAELDLGSGLGIDADYHRYSLRSTPGPTVLLLNEPDFNQDFNGNGTTTDLRVRSVQTVDFSRLEQEFSGRFRVRPAGSVETSIGYVLRLRNYESTQRYDVYNNTRRDRRNGLTLDVGYRLAPGTAVHIGGRGEIQKLTNTLRVTAPVEDVTDYSRKSFYLSWSQKL
jgi:hypothetical protein